MSTPSYERHVDNNNDTTVQLDALVKAQELSIFTIELCSNEKKFKPKFDKFLTQKIVDAAINTYVSADIANNIKVNKDVIRWHERRKYQETSTSNCTKLLALINISEQIYHLDGDKVVNWTKMATETRDALRSWKTKDKKRYGDLDK